MQQAHLKVLTARLNAGLIKQAAIDTRQAPPEAIKVVERFIDPKAEIATQRAADISRGKGVEAINRAIGGIDPRLLLGGVGAVGGSLIGALTAKKRKWLYALLGGLIGGGVGAGAGLGYKAWADAALQKARAAKRANYGDTSIQAWKGFGKGVKELASGAGDLAVKGGKAYMDASKAVAMYPVNKAREAYENLTPAEKANPLIKGVVHPVDTALETFGKVTAGGTSPEERAKILAKQLAKGSEMAELKDSTNALRREFDRRRALGITKVYVDNKTGRRIYQTAEGKFVEAEPANTSVYGRIKEGLSGWLRDWQNRWSDAEHFLTGTRFTPISPEYEDITGKLSDEDRTAINLTSEVPASAAGIAINDPKLPRSAAERRGLAAQLKAENDESVRRFALQHPAVQAAVAKQIAELKNQAGTSLSNAVDTKEFLANLGR